MRIPHASLLRRPDHRGTPSVNLRTRAIVQAERIVVARARCLGAGGLFLSFG
jgi:hypothetical protein